MTLLFFLALTFAISLTGFACILFIPAARTPDSAIGLPFWILMVWGPSLAAILLSLRAGHLQELLGRAVTLATIPLVAWGLILAPIALLVLLRPYAPGDATPVSAGLVASVVLFNLVLGPLGEELGWRGYLQEGLEQYTGWLLASLLVGAIWFAWHLPLWLIDTPHAQISLALYFGHVMCYAIIIGAGYTLSGGSVLPAILIHLAVNVASNLAVFAGFGDPNAWFSASLWPYAAISVVSVLIVYTRTGQTGF